MQYQLEPLDVGQILDRMFRIYGANLDKILGIAFMGHLPALLMGPILIPSLATLGESSSGIFFAGAGTLFYGLVVGLAYVLTTAAVVWFVSKKTLGETLSVTDSYRLGLKRLLPLLIAQIMMAFCLGLLFFASAMMVGMFAAVLPFSLIVTFPTLAIVFVWLFISILLLVPVIVLEDIEAGDGIRRAWNLLKFYRWRALVVWVITMIMATLVGAALNGTFSLVAIFGMQVDPMAPPLWYAVIGNLLNTLSSILTMPLSSIGLTLLYYDCRIRKEGFDLEMMAETFKQPIDY